MLATALLCAAVSIQEPSPPPAPAPAAIDEGAEHRTRAVEAAANALHRLRRAPSEPPREAFATASATLERAVERLVTEPDGLTPEQCARAIEVLWRTEQVVACLEVCELAQRAFGPTLELHGQLGLCRLAMAEEAPTGAKVRALAAASAASFTAAQQLGEHEAAVLFLHQALAVACDFDGAIAAFDRACAHERFGATLRERRHGLRAIYCLTAGRAGDAVRELEAAAAAGEQIDRDGLVIEVRARALAGDHERAVARAEAAWKEQPIARNLALLVDVLGFTGEVDRALALLLANEPVQGRMSAAEVAEIRRSRAALACLLEQRGKRSEHLREKLQAALEHTVKLRGVASIRVVDTSLPGGRQEGADLNGAPLAVAHHVLQQPFTAHTWADDVLFVVCVEDAATWRASAVERALLEAVVKDTKDQVVGPDALAKARRVLAGHRMMPFAEGVLTATRLLDAR